MCQPYRARTKGKTESGVKYVKRNGLADLEFLSFAALEAHLGCWMQEADERVQGTTHEVPRIRFGRDEQDKLRSLPALPLPAPERRIRRRVANDCLVDVDTIRYSVPHALVRDDVEVLVGDDDVRIFHGGAEVARHRRSFEPHTRVIDPAHYEGLWRTRTTSETMVDAGSMSRSLADYAAVIEGGVG